MGKVKGIHKKDDFLQLSNRISHAMLFVHKESVILTQNFVTLMFHMIFFAYKKRIYNPYSQHNDYTVMTMTVVLLWAHKKFTQHPVIFFSARSLLFFSTMYLHTAI